ncbi:MAG TPA: hypothetical protein VHV83_05400, partial [Armatimonadota bacterium]|nr:hypothetical protein [Armatimonadota bacterium]
RYALTSWGGANGGEVDPSTGALKMNGNKVVIAEFARLKYAVTTHTAGGGVITVRKVTLASKGTDYFDENDTVEITATPNVGWQFDHWEGNLSGNETSRTVTLTSDMMITGVFVQSDNPALVSTFASVKDFDGSLPLGQWYAKPVYMNFAVLNGQEGILGSDVSLSKTSVSVTAGQYTGVSTALADKKFTLSGVKSRMLTYSTREISVDRRMRDRERELFSERKPFAVRSATRAVISEGTQLTFKVTSSQGTLSRPATCKKVGTHCYIFVDNSSLQDAILTSTAIANFATYFDNMAYPLDNNLFGSDPVDVDGDSHVFILFSPLGNYAEGYFSPDDKFPQSVYSDSNAHDMFYLTIPSSTSEITFLQGTLAHEYQHMINFDRRMTLSVPYEQVWLNESMSQLAMYLCTSELYDATPYYLNGNATSLTIWDYNELDGASIYLNYAAAQLFSVYLYDRFYQHGITNIFRSIEDSSVTGMDNVTQATGIAFNELFCDWSTALVLSNTGVTTDPKYQYSSINLRSNGLNGLQPSYSWNLNTTSGTLTKSIRAYCPVVLAFSNIAGNSYLKIIGASADGVFITPDHYVSN